MSERCSTCSMPTVYVTRHDGPALVCPRPACPGHDLTAHAAPPLGATSVVVAQAVPEREPAAAATTAGTRAAPPAATPKGGEPAMPKQPTTTSKPNVAKLPGPGVSAKLGDFLAAGGPSAKPPSTAGKSTGGLPQNKRGGSRQ